MAKTDNVQDFFIDLANIIRFKLNDNTRKIKPIDVAGVIKNEIIADDFGIIGPSMRDITGDGCTGVVRLAFIEGGSTIMDSAFSNLVNLEDVLFSDDIIEIGSDAFKNCSNLKKITFPDSILSVRKDAFTNTAWYDALDDGYVYIGRALYSYKGTAIEPIILKENTYSITTNCFSNHKEITSVTINNGLETIGLNAFSGCTNLEAINLPESIKVMENSVFQDCSSLKIISVPSQISTIPSGFCTGCTNLKTVTFNGTIRIIFGVAFSNCPNVELYDFSKNGSEIPILYSGAFTTMKTGCKILVPKGMANAWISKDAWKPYANYIKES